jgi:hypothetical protein
MRRGFISEESTAKQTISLPAFCRLQDPTGILVWQPCARYLCRSSDRRGDLLSLLG